MKITLKNEKDQLLAVRDCPENKDRDFNFLPVTAEDLKAAGKKILLQFELPILNIHGYWAPQSGKPLRPCTELFWEFTLHSSQQSDKPYLAFFDMTQQNVATIALSCVHDDVQMRFKMDQMRCCYQIHITVAVVPETEPFALMLSFAPKRWNLLTEPWRRAVLPQGKPVFPADAFQPVYCTWYAVHAALTNEFLDSAAKQAAELGCRTFIVDDGWSYEEMKRVCPEKMAEGWYRDIGNWTVSEKKLPDFRKHVKYAQSLGLKYLLWTAPFFAGVSSEEYQEAKKENALHKTSWSDVGFLKPGSKTAEKAITLLANVMRDLGLDGLKIDFLDCMHGDTEEPYSRKFESYFRKMAAELRKIRPDGLFEFRQSYSNPQMLEYGTQFRAGDVPFDFMQNINSLAEIRISLGDGVPCHADPVYFHPQESACNVAHHMIASLAGVPMISMDLDHLSPEQKKVIQHYLDFYQEHLQTFSFGHWDVVYRLEALSFLTVESEKEAVAIILDPGVTGYLNERFAGKEFYLLNLTGNTIRLKNAEGLDCFGTSCGGDTAPAGGLLKRS